MTSLTNGGLADGPRWAHRALSDGALDGLECLHRMIEARAKGAVQLGGDVPGGGADMAPGPAEVLNLVDAGVLGEQSAVEIDDGHATFGHMQELGPSQTFGQTSRGGCQVREGVGCLAQVGGGATHVEAVTLGFS